MPKTYCSCSGRSIFDVTVSQYLLSIFEAILKEPMTGVIEEKTVTLPHLTSKPLNIHEVWCSPGQLLTQATGSTSSVPPSDELLATLNRMRQLQKHLDFGPNRLTFGV